MASLQQTLTAERAKHQQQLQGLQRRVQALTDEQAGYKV